MSAFEIFKDSSGDENASGSVSSNSNLSKMNQQRGQAFNQKRVACGDLPLQPRSNFSLQTRSKIPLAVISHNVVGRDPINTNISRQPLQSVSMGLSSAVPTTFPTPPVAQFQAFKMCDDKENFPKPSILRNTTVFMPPSSNTLTTFTKPLNWETKSEITLAKAAEIPTDSQSIVNSPMICDVDEKSETIIETHSIGTQTSVSRLPFFLRNQFQLNGPANNVKHQQAYHLLQLEQFAKYLIPEISEYESDIHNYLRQSEVENRPKAFYIRQQPEVTEKMRSVLIDWLVEVAEEYRLQTETLYLAISYIDRFMSVMTITKLNLQLLGTTSLFLATKYEEIYPPELSEFIYITDDAYTRDQMLSMERKIVQVLEFKLSLPPTPLAFIKQFCAVNKLNLRTMHFAMYLCELSVLNSENYLLYLPSILAASSILLARYHLMNNENNVEYELNSIMKENCPNQMTLSDDTEDNDVTDGDKLVSVMDYFGKKPSAFPIFNCNTLDAMNITQSTPKDNSTTSKTNDNHNGSDKIWSQTLETYTRYSVSDLFECVTYLQSTYIESPKMKLTAIRNKYQERKYSSVSLIVPKSETVLLSDLKPDSNSDFMSE